MTTGTLTRRIENPARLDALARTGLLEGDPDPRFERITRLATELLGAPVSLVTLVGGQHQRFVGRWPSNQQRQPNRGA